MEQMSLIGAQMMREVEQNDQGECWSDEEKYRTEYVNDRLKHWEKSWLHKYDDGRITNRNDMNNGNADYKSYCERVFELFQSIQKFWNQDQ